MITIKTLSKDSIALHYNDDYYLIEDSCSTIIRRAHGNFRQRIFTGKFEDISKQNENLVVGKGIYDDNGLKNGLFTFRYLNGNLRSKGLFKNNMYDGIWETCYPTGKPQLIFTANNNNTVSITDAWDIDGKKIIDKGKGDYQVDAGTVYWKGKLLEGKPDGTWRAYKINDRSYNEIVVENFKNGQFQKGKGAAGEYKDESHINFISSTIVPFIDAEKFKLSATSCNEIPRKSVTNAQYRYGNPAFSDEISRLIKPYMGRYDLHAYDGELDLEGVIMESGNIAYLKQKNVFGNNISSPLIAELRKLPALEPALLDGKPVKQKILFVFKFSADMYKFTYRFLPLEAQK